MRRWLLILCFCLSSIGASGKPMRSGSPLKRQFVFTRNVVKLIEFIHSKGYNCTMGEAWRTQAQALTYAKLGIGIVNSNHCSRLAIDLNLFDAKDNYLCNRGAYLQFGEYWEKLDSYNEWGRRWKSQDLNHFEMD